jgi:transcriptional regulator GlxA family with amidase domain
MPGTDRASAGGEPESIGFLLVPGFSAMAFFSAVEPLRVANRLSGQHLYSWRIYALNGESVAASNGMRILADAILGADHPPNLIVCAGFEPERAETRSTLATLRRLARAGVRLGGLDTGAHVLARAGLLEGMRACVHWEALAAFREEFPAIEVTDEIYELREPVFTCGGGTASLDMMLALIRARHGAELAAAVSEQFLHDRIRGSNDLQRMEVTARLHLREGKVVEAIKLMETNFEQVLDVETLAERLGVTRRHLERLFHAELGRSPARHYREMRLARARELLRQSALSVVQVAVATGFNSASALSRCYREHFGRSPHSDRQEPEAA